jgi:hypothetical protein
MTVMSVHHRVRSTGECHRSERQNWRSLYHVTEISLQDSFTNLELKDDYVNLDLKLSSLLFWHMTLIIILYQDEKN